MRLLLVPALLAGCVPLPEPVGVIALTDEPERYAGKRIEVCGDLHASVSHKRDADRPEPGFNLYSPGGEGSLMHGRVGVFIPKGTWLSPWEGKRVCLVGALTHWTGLSVEQVFARPFREVTSGAVDSQWRFNATSARAAGATRH